jgi:hypothetical protein
VPFASGVEYPSINSAPVVTYENAQVSRRVFDFNVNFAGAGVAECIDHSFTANAVNFVSNDWM